MSGLEDLGLRVAGAIAAGEFELARALMEEAIRHRTSARPTSASQEAGE